MSEQNQINLDTEAIFYYDQHVTGHFFLETKFGLYEWAAPSSAILSKGLAYNWDKDGGNNSIKKSSYSSITDLTVGQGRHLVYKGRRLIGDYCGDKVTFDCLPAPSPSNKQSNNLTLSVDEEARFELCDLLGQAQILLCRCARLLVDENGGNKDHLNKIVDSIGNVQGVQGAILKEMKII